MPCKDFLIKISRRCQKCFLFQILLHIKIEPSLCVKLSKFEVRDWVNRNPRQMHWWDQHVEDLETPDLEEICHQVLDLYAQPVTATKDALVSPPPGAVPKV